MLFPKQILRREPKLVKRTESRVKVLYSVYENCSYANAEQTLNKKTADQGGLLLAKFSPALQALSHLQIDVPLPLQARAWAAALL